MARSRDFVLRIVGDVEDASRSLSNIDSKLGGFGSKLKGIAGAVGIGLAVDQVVQFGQESVEAASNLEQAMGAVDAVFGPASAKIKAFGENSAEAVGLSEAAFAQGTANIGALLQNMGFSADKAAAKSIGLTQVGADLAAQYGGDVTGALDAVNSALKGQFDPLEKYAISLTAASVEQKAVEMGLIAEGEQLDASAKAQATLALVTEQGAKAQGAFGREADTLAGKQARATASMEDAQAAIGTALMPVISELVGIIGKYLAPVLEKLAPVIAAVAELLGPILEPILTVLGELLMVVASILTGDFEGAFEHTKGVLKGFANFFRAVVNMVIKGWNALDLQIDWTVPSWVPGIGGKGIHISDVFPDIPLVSMLASGGIVRGPTLAVVGEAGPEAVVPLGRGGGMGNTYNLNVTVQPGSDPVQVGTSIVEAIKVYERVNGPAWRTA